MLLSVQCPDSIRPLLSERTYLIYCIPFTFQLVQAFCSTFSILSPRVERNLAKITPPNPWALVVVIYAPCTIQGAEFSPVHGRRWLITSNLGMRPNGCRSLNVYESNLAEMKPFAAANEDKTQPARKDRPAPSGLNSPLNQK
jgi:hypothetical protein